MTSNFSGPTFIIYAYIKHIVQQITEKAGLMFLTVSLTAPKVKIGLEPVHSNGPRKQCYKIILISQERSIGSANRDVMQTIYFLIALYFWMGKSCIHCANERLLMMGCPKHFREIPYGTVWVGQPSPFGVVNLLLLVPFSHSNNFR